MATKSRTPSLIAFPIATRSAQLVNPNEAFSMLQPANTEPSAAKSAAPTVYCEYGAYAWARARFAIWIRTRIVSVSRSTLAARFFLVLGLVGGGFFSDMLCLDLDNAPVADRPHLQ